MKYLFAECVKLLPQVSVFVVLPFRVLHQDVFLQSRLLVSRVRAGKDFTNFYEI